MKRDLFIVLTFSFLTYFPSIFSLLILSVFESFSFIWNSLYVRGDKLNANIGADKIYSCIFVIFVFLFFVCFKVAIIQMKCLIDYYLFHVLEAVFTLHAVDMDNSE